MPRNFSPWPHSEIRAPLVGRRPGKPRSLSLYGETGKPIFRLISGFIQLFTFLICLGSYSVAGATDIRFPTVGWKLEQDVETPSYAVAEPANTNLNIDSVVLSCERGPTRRGLQLRLYLSEAGLLSPLGDRKELKDDPTVDLVIDGSSYPVQLLFADDFVVVADSADGVMPLLSDALLDALQGGRRMELRFQLAKVAHVQAPAFDGIATVDLQAGPSGAAVAALRRCAASNPAMTEVWQPTPRQGHPRHDADEPPCYAVLNRQRPTRGGALHL